MAHELCYVAPHNVEGSLVGGQILKQSELPTVQQIGPSKIFCNAIVEESTAGVAPITGAGIWLIDQKMQVVWMNSVMEKIYGPLEEARGKNCFSAFRGRTSKCPDCLPTKAFETGNIVSGYVSRVTKGGVNRFYQLVEAPLMNSDNEVINVLEIVLDVTEKARIEQSLQASEREYRALFEHAGTAVSVNDRNGLILKVNHAFEALSGFTKEEIESKMSFHDFVHPQDLKRIEDFTRLRVAGKPKVPDVYEFLFVTRAGEEKLIHISVSQMPNGDQVASLLDITEKWRLEEEVRNKEQFLANILRHSMDAIVAMDNRGVIRSWNRGAELMFDYKAKEILGKKFSSLFTKEFQRKRNVAEISNLFRQQGFLRNFVAKAVTKEGKELIVDITRTVIRDKNGEELGSSAILRDITETRKSEQRMIQQEKMLALGELAASLAHEIKNPLNSMVINMEVLKSHFSNVDEDKRALFSKYIDVLASETGRLDKVMRGFLDFSKPIEWKFEKTDLAKVLTHVIQLVQPQATKLKIKCKAIVPQKLALIDGSEDHLKQVFLNLFLNAIQAMPEGGTLTVTAKVEKPHSVSVSIADTGAGIARQNFNRIFDFYFSTKEKGSGLGLPLVKRLVTAHGGEIHFKSKVNHGTKFTVTFPTV